MFKVTFQVIENTTLPIQVYNAEGAALHSQGDPGEIERQIQTDRNQTDWSHIDFFTLIQLSKWTAQRPLTLTKKMRPHVNWGICVRCLPSPWVAHPAFRGRGTLQKSRLPLSWSSEDSWVSGADIPRFRFQHPYMLFGKVKQISGLHLRNKAAVIVHATVSIY